MRAGHTYEKAAISAWLDGHSTSPKTNQPLQTNMMFENHAIRQLVEKLELH